MLGQLQIVKGINAAIYRTGIEGAAYIQRCPANFARPCYYISAVKEDVRSDNKRLVHVTSYFTITYFPQLVKHQEYCTAEALLVAQNAYSAPDISIHSTRVGGDYVRFSARIFADRESRNHCAIFIRWNCRRSCLHRASGRILR